MSKWTPEKRGLDQTGQQGDSLAEVQRAYLQVKREREALQAENKRLREERDDLRDVLNRIVSRHPDFEKQVAEYRQALEGSE